MKTILLPECLLSVFNLSKYSWPKVVCLTSVIHRNRSGRILSEYFEFEFQGRFFSIHREYDSRNNVIYCKCLELIKYGE